ncbi:hypothetical protein QWZ17_17870 [Mucilaginibacter flavus]|nr:hypothetical protein [Mucilaginibacter flavus]
MTLVIAAIVAAIIVVVLNKQQANKVSNNMYADDVQHLYMLTTAEYKIKALESRQYVPINDELARLTMNYRRGEIQLNELNSKLDYLLAEFKINDNELVEAV